MAVACAALASCNQSPVETATCKALSAEVVSLRKGLSSRLHGSFPNSAPQATQLATEMANTISLMKLNLDLMSAHRCPMPTEPISTDTYVIAVKACLLSPDDERREKCDEANWMTTAEIEAANKASKKAEAK